MALEGFNEEFGVRPGSAPLPRWNGPATCQFWKTSVTDFRCFLKDAVTAGHNVSDDLNGPGAVGLGQMDSTAGSTRSKLAALRGGSVEYLHCGRRASDFRGG